MSTISATVRLRPTRIGFLVNPTDMASVRQVFQTCSCLWGGYYNPIIPVCDIVPDAWNEFPPPKIASRELSDGYLEFFEPDVFVETEQGLGEKAGIAPLNIDYGRPRVMSIDTFFKHDAPWEFSVPFGVDVLDVYRSIHEKEFKFVPRHEHPVVLFDGDTESTPFIEAAFGGFPSTGPLRVFADHYVNAFKATKLAPTADHWVKVIKEGFSVPLSFTTEELEREPGGGWDRPTIFVVDPASPLDLIDLWNIRLFHSQVIPITLPWLKEAGAYIADLIRINHRPLPGNPNGVMISTSLQFGRSIMSGDYQAAVEKGHAIIADCGLDKVPAEALSMKLSYDRLRNYGRDDFVHRPQRIQISAASSDLELTLTEDPPGASCRFTSLSPEFADEVRGHGAAQWVNVLKFRDYGSNHTLALSLPSSFVTDKSRSLRLGDRMGICREGFVLPQTYKNHHEYFHLLDGRTVVIEWLEQHGVKAKASEPGRIAEQVLGSLGGFWGLEYSPIKKPLNCWTKWRRVSADMKVAPLRSTRIGAFPSKNGPTSLTGDQAAPSLIAEPSAWSFSLEQIFSGSALKSVAPIALNATGMGSIISALSLSVSGA